MDETPMGEAVAASPAERATDLAILEELEVELAEVEAALQRLDAVETTVVADAEAPEPSDFHPQT